MSDTKLRIAEIFTSLQGEGSLVGTPSTFIRVSGCNLRCSWCDTPYASHTPEGPVMEVTEIAEQVLSVNAAHVVITGGEPMIFGAVPELCRILRVAGRHITIETAGTSYYDLPCDLMSISPKLANSTPKGEQKTKHEDVRRNLEPLAQLTRRYACQFKFVVQCAADLVEIDALLRELPAHDHAIYLMAEGTDAELIRQRQRELVRPCIERGWRLTPRMHIDLFGNSRGT